MRGNTYTDTDVVLRKAGSEKVNPFIIDRPRGSKGSLPVGISARRHLPEKTGVTSTTATWLSRSRRQDLTLAAPSVTRPKPRRVSLAASHRNLFGTADTGLEALVSDRRERYFATYREPFIFDSIFPRSSPCSEVTSVRRSDDQAEGTFIEASRVVGDQTRGPCDRVSNRRLY